MAVLIGDESRAVLRQYLSGFLSRSQLDVWLSQAEFDDDLAQDERDELAAILLLIIEIGEGSASESELQEAIRHLLENPDPEFIRVWEASNRRLPRSFTEHHGVQEHLVFFSPDRLVLGEPWYRPLPPRLEIGRSRAGTASQSEIHEFSLT